jgi:hypothetical protein
VQTTYGADHLQIRIADPTHCAEARGDRMDGEGADRMPPDELAALLADNVAPEDYDTLLAVIAPAIDAAADDQTQTYWEAVYAALIQ